MNNTTPLQVTYLGGPTAILEIAGLRFITDPTLDPADTVYNIGGDLTVTKLSASAAGTIGHIDVVLLSHDQHFDNFDHAGRELAKQAGRIFTTAAGAQRLGGNSTGLQPWEQHTITAPNGDSITITATPARHGPSGIEPVSGDVTGFVISAGGKHPFEVYITGDTVFYEGVTDVAKRFQPAYVLAFAGAAQPRGPFHVTMSTNDVIDTAHAFGEAVIVPLHYEGWSHYTQGQDALRKSFDALGLGHRLQLLTAGVTIPLVVERR